MLANPVKAARLLLELKEAVPFDVELSDRLVKHLRAQGDTLANETRFSVSSLSYAGDEGGIVCHTTPSDDGKTLVVSLTQVRVSRSMPLARAIADYQKHRVKKLKKQGAV